MSPPAPGPPVRRRLAASSWALVPVLLVVVMGGCGSDDPATTLRVDAEARRSAPARTVLRWWESLARQDQEGVLTGLTPEARGRLDDRRTRSALAKGLADWARATVPRVLYVERRPGEATVYLEIEGGDLLGERLIRREVMLLALPLARRGDGWLIDNSVWLATQVDRYAAIDLRDLTGQDGP